MWFFSNTSVHFSLRASKDLQIEKPHVADDTGSYLRSCFSIGHHAPTLARARCKTPSDGRRAAPIRFDRSLRAGAARTCVEPLAEQRGRLAETLEREPPALAPIARMVAVDPVALLALNSPGLKTS